MSRDDRIPFNDSTPQPAFEVDEQALAEPGAFWQRDEDQATKVLPAYDADQQTTQAIGQQPEQTTPRQHAPDAATVRLGTSPPHRPAAQHPAPAQAAHSASGTGGAHRHLSDRGMNSDSAGNAEDRKSVV